MDLRKKYFEILNMANDSLILPLGKNKDKFFYMEDIYCAAFAALINLDIERETINDYYVIKDGDKVFSIEKSLIDKFDRENISDDFIEENLPKKDKLFDDKDLTKSDIDYIDRHLQNNNIKDEIDDFDELYDGIDSSDELEDFSEDLTSGEQDSEKEIEDSQEEDVAPVNEEYEFEDLNEDQFFDDEPDFEFADEPDFPNNDIPLEFVDDVNYEEPDLEFIDGGFDQSNDLTAQEFEKDSDNAPPDEKHESVSRVESSDDIDPIMPYSMHENDFTFSTAAISINDFGQRTDVKLIAVPLRVDIDTPNILVDVITKSGTKVYLSDEDKKVVANVDGYDIIVSGYMDDNGIFNSDVFVDGVEEDSVKIRQTYNDGGTKGHTMAYDPDNNVVIHVAPIGNKNNSRMFANFIYYINNNGDKIYGDTSTNKNGVEFDVNGQSHILKATWDRDQNFILSLT